MQRTKIIIANCNSILNDMQHSFKTKYGASIISKKEELSIENVSEIDPTHIFFMHWSWIIPEEIFNKYNCIVFHMTDLPYGRGGSPLQNLIIRGHKETKISALKVDKGIDTGDIFLKKDLSLVGTADIIFLRAGKIIEEMIDEIILEKIKPTPQIGNPVYFKRRMPSESLITDEITTIEALYDFIRMLDGKNYPAAFIRQGAFKIEFSGATINDQNQLIANVKFIKE